MVASLSQVRHGGNIALAGVFELDLSLDKMAAISQKTFQMHFRKRKSLYFDLIYREVSPIDNKSALTPYMREAIAWTSADSVSWRHICGTRGRWLNENECILNKWEFHWSACLFDILDYKVAYYVGAHINKNV